MNAVMVTSIVVFAFAVSALVIAWRRMARALEEARAEEELAREFERFEERAAGQERGASRKPK